MEEFSVVVVRPGLRLTDVGLEAVVGFVGVILLGPQLVWFLMC